MSHYAAGCRTLKDKERIIKLGKKPCSKCNKTKNLEYFSKQETGFLGRRSDCKKCQNERQKTYLATDPEYRKRQYEIRDNWKKDNLKYHREYNRHLYHRKNTHKGPRKPCSFCERST